MRTLRRAPVRWNMRRKIVAFIIALVISFAAWASLEAQEAPGEGMLLRIDMTEQRDYISLYHYCQGRMKPIGTAEPGYVESFDVRHGDLYACSHEGYIVLRAEGWNVPIPLDLLRQKDKELAPDGLMAVLLCPKKLSTDIWFYGTRTTHLTCVEAKRSQEKK